MCDRLLSTDKCISYAFENDIYKRVCTAYVGKDECNTMIYKTKTNTNNMHLWIT